MKYEEFHAREKKILAECKPLIKDLKLDEFNKKMDELVELQEQYIQEREKSQRRKKQDAYEYGR